MNAIPTNRLVQKIAKQVLAEIADEISAESTERSLVEAAETLLARHGVFETWYYDCPALVLLGSRSCLSVSGRDYVPSEERVGQSNLVTIDLSPKMATSIGDCARSFVVEDGRVVNAPSSKEFREGVSVILELHAAMRRFVTSETRFSDLYHFANEEIVAAGYENLDFLQNLGHSITSCLADRLFIDRDTCEILGSVEYFTFEPHIRRQGEQWGFKHEEIYGFDAKGRLDML